MRFAQALLITDGVVLFCYGSVSLFLLPAAYGQPYMSRARLLYGLLPAGLGLASLICSVWQSVREGRTG
jgi:hypothetical protein